MTSAQELIITLLGCGWYRPTDVSGAWEKGKSSGGDRIDKNATRSLSLKRKKIEGRLSHFNIGFDSWPCKIRYGSCGGLIEQLCLRMLQRQRLSRQLRHSLI